ncbi:unnamed protein product [Orchesella dallaii]|uniref:Uncharacterized protein n=1 Tax=Orchesella dallaii TaxID=48710 RepID=A0ABP1PX96_9HEXA
MSKTQMFQRATNTFLKMNLTPYLTDLMEARSYLQGIINEEIVKSINVHVPVLENFSRDDERLDLVHAIARMKEWTYMEDFETILKETSNGKKVDLVAKTKLHIAASQTHDLRNAIDRKHVRTEPETNDNLALWTAKQSFSIKDLFKADPTLFHAVVSFSHLQKGNAKLVIDDEDEGSKRNSEVGFHRKKPTAGTSYTKSANSLPSLHSMVIGFAKARAVRNVKEVGKPTSAGQTLTEFRKRVSKADRFSDSLQAQANKLVPIITLKQLRRSFESKGLTQL